MPIPRMEPLPTPERYDSAYNEAHTRLRELGGIKEHLANRALEVQFDESLQNTEHAMVTHALRLAVEPMLQSDEERNDEAYAYVNGFVTTGAMLDILHSKTHTHEHRLASVEAWMEGVLQDATVAQAPDAAELLIGKARGLGASGLQSVGQYSLSTMAEWAQDLYGDAGEHQRLFYLGSGVAISGSRIYQSAVNDAFITRMREHDASDGDR